MIQLFAKLLQWQFQQTAHTQLLFHKHPARGGDSVKTWNHAETSYCIYEESITVVVWCHRFPNRSAIAIALLVTLRNCQWPMERDGETCHVPIMLPTKPKNTRIRSNVNNERTESRSLSRFKWNTCDETIIKFIAILVPRLWFVRPKGLAARFLPPYILYRGSICGRIFRRCYVIPIRSTHRPFWYTHFSHFQFSRIFRDLEHRFWRFGGGGEELSHFF